MSESLSQQSVSLIRWDTDGWVGYDVYDGNDAIGHIRRRDGGREWAWACPNWNGFIGFLPRRVDAVQMLLDVNALGRTERSDD